MISSLPGKASRVLAKSRGLASDLTGVLNDANIVFYFNQFRS